MVRLTDCLYMTIAVDWDVKQQTEPNKQTIILNSLFALILKAPVTNSAVVKYVIF